MRSLGMALMAVAAGLGITGCASVSMMPAPSADSRQRPDASEVRVASPVARASSVAVSGIIWNDPVYADETVTLSLVVKNVTKHDLYVPVEFNCKNYTFCPDGVGKVYVHGDGGPAQFEDFVRLKPGGVAVFSPDVSLLEPAGEGEFSVHYYNNLLPDVEQKLKVTGVPYLIRLDYDFGKIKVRESERALPAPPAPQAPATAPPARPAFRGRR